MMIEQIDKMSAPSRERAQQLFDKVFLLLKFVEFLISFM